MEDIAEEGFNFFHGDNAAELALKGGNTLIYKAARVDGVEISEISVDVQGEAVHGDETRAVHSDSAYFSLFGSTDADPDTGGTLYSLPYYAIFGKQADNGLFESTDIALHAEAVTKQVYNRIDHELTGAMESDVASAQNFDKLYARQAVKDVSLIGMTTKGIDRIVFYGKEHLIGQFCASIFAGFAKRVKHLLLSREGFAIVHQT